jgi:RNA-directed DNA polymerase
VEGRGGLDVELLEGKTVETSSSEIVSTRLERIAKLAREAPDMVLTTLAHHIDGVWMLEAYRRTRKDGATGVDRQSAEEFAQNLERNLQALLDSAKAGTYRAPPVRRVHIPKGHGQETRPIGIPTFADKVLQRAVAMVLGAVYKTSFVDGSYGFRPGRSAHQALEVLQHSLVKTAGGWVLEIDIKKFFDTLDHRHVQEILRQRVRDGVIGRLVGKWLNAGVQERGMLSYPEAGTPQGGVISPLLANIYLHEVLDVWFEREVKPRLRGTSTLIRYADDAVLVFTDESDARRVLEVLPKRFARYGLKLHPEKTRLVAFRRPDRRNGDEEGEDGSFDLLGFTHFWAKSLKGNWVVRRRTAKDRFSRALRRGYEWLKLMRHRRISEYWPLLVRKMRGHYGYYGITGNFDRIQAFYQQMQRLWRRVLTRRSQRSPKSWAYMKRVLRRYPLPRPRVVHVWRKLRSETTS